MMDPLNLTVAPEYAGARLDKWLSDEVDDLSRARLQALIKAGHVMRDGIAVMEPKHKISAGEDYNLTLPEPVDAVPKPQNIPLNVVYEDDAVIVVDKTPDMVVHPAFGNPDGTLVNALLHHCRGSLSGIGGVVRPGIVHRIDKETSGLMVAAKHDQAHQHLAAQFAEHSIHRVYRAFIHGCPRSKAGRIETQIGRSPHDRKKMAVVPAGGKWAATLYDTVETFAGLDGAVTASEVQCRLETGRTHQVRVHMAHLGHPLIGDPLYGRKRKLELKMSDTGHLEGDFFQRQALHAAELGFVHPGSAKQLLFKSELPQDMLLLQRTLSRSVTD